jgi:acyl carrier protein
MSEPTIESRVRAVVARVAGRANGEALPGSADLFRELGIQSTDALDLLLSLEDEFAVSIPDDAFGESRTLLALVTLIEGLR